MQGIWKLTLFFLFCLVMALLLTMPVQHLLPFVKLPPALRLAGIDGSLLSGKADEVSINRFPLREVNYRYLPSCIAKLKICYRVSYERGSLQLAYDLLNGDTEASEALVDYQALEIAQYLPPLPVAPQGTLELRVERLDIHQGSPMAFDGKLLWRDLGVNDDGIRLNIGDYQVDISGSPKQYDLLFSDLGATLKVEGDGRIGPDGQYAFDVRIESESALEPQVKNVLELVTRKTGYNQYRVEQKGRLPANLTRRLFGE